MKTRIAITAVSALLVAPGVALATTVSGTAAGTGQAEAGEGTAAHGDLDVEAEATVRPGDAAELPVLDRPEPSRPDPADALPGDGPSAPDRPDTSDLPDLPEVPDAPDAPDAPERPEPSAPDRPQPPTDDALPELRDPDGQNDDTDRDSTGDDDHGRSESPSGSQGSISVEDRQRTSIAVDGSGPRVDRERETTARVGEREIGR